MPMIYHRIRDSSNESSLHIRWPKIQELQLQYHSFHWVLRVDLLKTKWFYLHAVQGTFRVFSVHHNLRHRLCSFFMYQLSQPHMTIGPFTALNYMDLFGIVMSAFQHTALVCHHFPFKEQLSSDFMTSQSLSSWFWSPGGGKLLLLILFPFYLVNSNGARCHLVQQEFSIYIMSDFLQTHGLHQPDFLSIINSWVSSTHVHLLWMPTCHPCSFSSALYIFLISGLPKWVIFRYCSQRLRLAYIKILMK